MRKSFLLIYFLVSGFLYSQNKYPQIGVGLGIGAFNGDFPTQTVFGGTLLFETYSPFKMFDKIGVQLNYAQRLEKFLPGDYHFDYYSNFTSLEAFGGFIQPISDNLTIGENIGLLVLNDRSFDDIDTWNIGLGLAFGVSSPISKNLEICLYIDSGLTFTNTNSSYFLANFILKFEI